MHLLYELKKRCSIAKALPESEGNPAKLLEELEVFVGLVSNSFEMTKKRNSKKVIILIDGINIIEGQSGTTTSLLSYLPRSYPPGIRVILTTQTSTPSFDVSLNNKNVKKRRQQKDMHKEKIFIYTNGTIKRGRNQQNDR